jgi:hypothetical protein
MEGRDVTQPIEKILDDLVPDWRDITRKMSANGSTDEEITAELQSRIRAQIDPLLDLYNDLGHQGDPSEPRA